MLETKKSKKPIHMSLITTSRLVNIGKSTLTTVVPIKMIGHESSSTALSIRALLPQPLDFAAIINLIELEHSELDLLLLVLDLLGLGVGLLLSLLGSTPQSKHQVESGLLLDIVVSEGAAVLELFSSENETLLVWRDALLVLNLGFHIVDCVRRLNLEGYSLSRQGFHEDLHLRLLGVLEMRSKWGSRFRLMVFCIIWVFEEGNIRVCFG